MLRPLTGRLPRLVPIEGNVVMSWTGSLYSVMIIVLAYIDMGLAPQLSQGLCELPRTFK